MITTTMLTIDERFLSDPAVKADFGGESAEYAIFDDTVATHLTMVKAFERDASRTDRRTLSAFTKTTMQSFAQLLQIRTKVAATKAALIAKLKDQQNDWTTGYQVETYQALRRTEVLRRYLEALAISTARWLRCHYGDPEEIAPLLGVESDEIHRVYDLTEERQLAASMLEAIHDPALFPLYGISRETVSSME